LLLVCVLPLQHAHETAGAAGIRHSPRPLWGRKTNANLGRIVPRDREVAFAEAAFAIGTVIASEATLNSASSFRGDAKHRTRNLATTRRARRIRSVAFKADGRRSTLSRNTSGAWRCRFLLSWATRMTRASNRACFSSRTFRLRGWRCFRRPATFSISRAGAFQRNAGALPGAGGSASLAAARSCLAACLRMGPRRQSVALAQSGRSRDVWP
jgi:hypothetical protein